MWITIINLNCLGCLDMPKIFASAFCSSARTSSRTAEIWMCGDGMDAGEIERILALKEQVGSRKTRIFGLWELGPQHQVSWRERKAILGNYGDPSRRMGGLMLHVRWCLSSSHQASFTDRTPPCWSCCAGRLRLVDWNLTSYCCRSMWIHSGGELMLLPAATCMFSALPMPCTGQEE